MIYAEGQFVGLPDVHRLYLLAMPAYNANFPTHLDIQVNIQQVSDVSAAAALAAVERAAKPHAGVSVLDRAGFTTQQTSPLNPMLALFYALLGLAIFNALLGITNTLALLFFSWALVSALDEQGLTVFRIPYGSLSIIAGMVAAIGPSRRAAKLNVLKAVTSD